MRTIHRYVRLAAASSALAFLSANALAQSDYNTTAIEKAQLPRFCWAQMNIPGASGDDFRIIDCGPAANHYCSSLVYLLRAKGHVPYKQFRFNLMGVADADLRYTEKAIADYPKCNIRQHVQGTRVELEQLMKLYGYNRPRAK